MSLRIQIFVIICMVIILLNIFRLMSKKKIDYKYGLGWVLVDIVIIILAACPRILGYIASITGVVAPVNMLFFLGFILSLAIIFSLSMTISKLQAKVNRLSQEIAIMKKDAYDRAANGNADKTSNKVEGENR